MGPNGAGARARAGVIRTAIVADVTPGETSDLNDHPFEKSRV